VTTYAIIDFETTGLSPDYGDRATEIAAVVISDGNVVDRYQSLINPRRPIPQYVQQLTGITDSMVRKAPEAPQVMGELYQRIGSIPLLAHNASFDQRFLDAEYQRAGLSRRTEFACSMLLARRVYPNFGSHKLGNLVQQLKLPTTGTYHRAMVDADMTAHLMTRMLADLQARHGLKTATHDLLRKLQKVSKADIAGFIARHCQ
jgi:DNA polymerase-3 subunit epsilon